MKDATQEWRHPTGSVPDSVLIVALGPTKQDLLEVTTSHEPPEVLMSVDEVWGLNAGVNHFAGRVAYDVLWIMDHIAGEARKWPRYGDAIRAFYKRHAGAIITSQAEGEWGSLAHEYPLDFVLDRVGEENAYFHNSVPYLLAYAVAIGVKRIIIWGADYSHERTKRREEDRANAEYWLGYCRAKGIEVWLPETTTLCNMARGIWYYGYRDQPQRQGAS